MKIRTRNPDSEKIEMQMSSMIDVVFQLLIFFMLTLKIIPAEGDFNINMPLGAPSDQSLSEDLPPFKVRMVANADGALQELTYNGQSLGAGDAAFVRLNQQVLESVRRLGSVGDALEKQEIEIDPDYNLDYRYIIKAISKCSAYQSDGQTTELIRKIKFAPIRNEPQA